MSYQQPAVALPNQQGFTLIELLIALFVIAVGILGHSRLEFASLQNAREARFSQAAYSATMALSEKIRSAPVAALNGDYNFTNLTTGTAPTAPNNCKNSGVTCTQADLAQYQLQDWYNNASAVIPELRFSVEQDTTNLFTINLTWDSSLSGSGIANCDGDKTGQSHQCLSIELWVR